MAKKRVESLLERGRYELTARSGGGILSYEVWGYREGARTVVTRYNLAYINPDIYAGDNGRVLGYDNAHGYHHRHFMGRIEPVEFENYEVTLDRFQREWQQLVATQRGHDDDPTHSTHRRRR